MTVAYFVMEIGLESDIPTYAGGLGILAGDTAYTFADLGIPAVFVTLLYKGGYTKQRIGPGGQQLDSAATWPYAEKLTPLEQLVELDVGGQLMKVKLWRYTIKGVQNIPVIFLDSDLPENPPALRSLTERLYRSLGAERLTQEMLLGVGGYRALRTLGLDISLYIMNESHAALLTVELLKELKSPQEVRRHCIFTTHTPVAGGHDTFPLPMVQEVLKRYDWVDWTGETSGGILNLSKLASKYSCVTNAVSLKHEYVSRALLDKKDVEHVTNGVYHRRWVHEDLRIVLDRRLPLWSSDPSTLAKAYDIPTPELERAHSAAKERLLVLANAASKGGFRPDAFTIGVAKRITTYKRNGLILSDAARLASIADSVGGIQMVFAGKAHPDDDTGKGSLVQLMI